jgi:hypothetical protein
MCRERIIYVRNGCLASDDWAGTSPHFAKRTVLAGWQRLHAWATESPWAGHWVLDIGEGEFRLPVLNGFPQSLVSEDLARLTVRGKGSTLTTLVGLGGDASWAFIFRESRDLTVKGFRLTYSGDLVLGSSWIDLQSVRYARLVDLVLEPIAFWGVRCIGVGAGEAPSPGACEDLHVHDCRFVGPAATPGLDEPEALLIADTTRAHIARCCFEGIGEVGLGLWRAVSDADIEECNFEGVGYCVRVGRSTHDIRIADCDFKCVRGVHAAVDPDHLPNAPFATMLVVDRCDFIARTSGEGVGVTLYACEDAQVRASTFLGFESGIVLGDNESDPPPRNVLIQACTFQGDPIQTTWHYRCDIRVQKHGLALSGHVISDCCFRNEGPNHAALTLVTEFLPVVGGNEARAAEIWAAVGIVLDDSNRVCNVNTSEPWTGTFRLVELSGQFVATPYEGSLECCPAVLV